MRIRKRIKWGLIFSRLARLVRVIYIFAEDIFFTCYWYYLMMEDYARYLLADFFEAYDDFYHEVDNISIVFWHYCHILKEQAKYYWVGRRILEGLEKRPYRLLRLR